MEKTKTYFAHILVPTHIGSYVSAITNVHGIHVYFIESLTKHVENAAAGSGQKFRMGRKQFHESVCTNSVLQNWL